MKGGLGSKFDNLGLAKCDKNVAIVKTNSYKVLGDNSNGCRIYKGKNGRGSRFALPLPHPESG